MRLDSRHGCDWEIFDVERCALVDAPVVWIDDASATWGSPDTSLAGLASALFGQELSTITHYEKRIRILWESRMVLFNPLPDADVRDSEELPVLRDVVVEHKQGQRA